MAERETRTHTPGPWIVVSSWEGHTQTDGYRHRKRADDLAAWHNRQSGHTATVVSAQDAASAPALAARVEELERMLSVLVDHASETYPHFESERGQAEINTARAMLARAALSPGAK
jgi:hypothetical protein